MTGEKTRELIARDREVVSPSLTRSYPLAVDHASGSTIVDVDGKEYIDFASSVSVMNIGYNCAHVRRAVCDQISRMVHCGFSDFYAEPPVKLCEKLVAMTGYEKVFLSNSGTEAVEAAMKLAMWYSKRQALIAFYGAFHGRTLGSLSLTSSKMRHKEHFPSLRVVHSHYAYCYRCSLNLEYPGCGIECAYYIEKVIFRRELSPEDVAAIFVEPIQGEGGIVVPPADFHHVLRELCDKYGILLAVDEVQTGGFRTGTFLALDNFNVRGDILCMAKSIGGGIPLGATLSSSKIMSWEPGTHANTFGGNLLAAAGGYATLDFMESHKLGEKARKKGAYMRSKLEKLKSEFDIIGDVRGIGLMIGVEFASDDRTPLPAERDRVLERAFEEGLILLPAGESSIRFMPPLIIKKDEIDRGLEIFTQALAGGR